MNLYKFFENPRIYGYTQKLNPFTVSLYAALATNYVVLQPGQTVLDIGSGLGVHRSLFPGAEYTGIDINQEYVAHARRTYGDGFGVMDAGRLDFPDASFDHAISIAVCHHLDDATLTKMVSEALRVVKPEGALHIVDPVLPVSSFAPIKRLIFENDRGQHQRTLETMARTLARVARIESLDLRRGLLHDVCYFRLARASESLVETEPRRA